MNTDSDDGEPAFGETWLNHDGADRLSVSDLRGVKLFADGDLEALAKRLETCELRVLRAGEPLTAPDRPLAALYLVLGGRLSAHVGPPETAPVAVYEAGESTAGLAMLDDLTTGTVLVADTDARVLIVDEPVFWSMIEASHAVARNLLMMLGRRVRERNDGARRAERLKSAYQRHQLVDELTGLHNRRWLEGALKRLALRSTMNRDALSLLVVQIDGYQDYQHQFGEAATDAAIYAVAQVLRESLRPTDLVVRYGEKEFIVVLPYTDEKRALIVAERVREAVDAAVVTMDDESLLPSVTVSLGIAELSPQETAETLVGRAAAALKSPDGGGNHVAIAPAAPIASEPWGWLY